MSNTVIIERIYRSLKQNPIEIDETGVLDAVWLGAILPSTSQSGSSGLPADGDSQPIGSPSDSAISATSSEFRAQPSTESVQRSVRARGFADSTLTLRGDIIGLPRVPALPQALQLERKLRSLVRRDGSKTHVILDEQRTAEATAEARRLQPRFFRKKERTLSAVLVFECSPTMRLWQNITREIPKLFWRVGAFRALDSLYLDCFQSTPSLYSDRKLMRSAQPGQLGSGQEGHYVFLITDGRSSRWFDGTMQQQLINWNRQHSTVILPVVDSHMWNQTVFQKDKLVLGGLKWPRRSPQLKALHPRQTRAQVPLVGITPDQIGRLGPLIWADTNSKTPFFRMEFNVESNIPKSVAEFEPNEKLGKAAFDRFMSTKLPEVIGIARSFASIPLYLPIMRLTQHCLHANTGLSQLAEIMWSGMIYRRDFRTPISPSTDPNSIEFDFLPGIRDCLLNQASFDRVANVFDVLTRYLKQHAGFPSDHGTILDNPLSLIEWASSGLPDNQKPFAEVTSHVLKRLGGHYVDVGDELDRLMTKDIGRQQPVAAVNEVVNVVTVSKVVSSVARSSSFPPKDVLPYPYADVEVEDGTNLPKGTSYRVSNRSLPRDRYFPSKAQPSRHWQAKLNRLLARFTESKSKARIAMRFSQLRIPEFPGRSKKSELVREDGMLSFSGGFMRQDNFGSLTDAHEISQFGLFPISDVNGKPIQNSAGEPLAWRYGFSRSIALYGEKSDDDLLKQASELLAELPTVLATKIWKYWPDGFAKDAFKKKDLWLNALLEFGWDVAPDDPLYIPRFAMSEDSTTRIALSDKGHFPRIPITCSRQEASEIAHEYGFPTEIYSEISDICDYSCSFLERLVQIAQAEGIVFPGLDNRVVEKSAALEQLASIVIDLLTDCEDARASIIKFNNLSPTLSSAELAETMISSGSPMQYLFNCVVGRPAFVPAREAHYKKSMLLIAHAFAPVCMGTKNLSSVSDMVKYWTADFAEIDTREPHVAKAVVGLIYGVPIDGQEFTVNPRSGRDFAASFPVPKNLPAEADDVVQVFIEGLAKFFRTSPVLGVVRAELKVHKDKGVHLCILFSESYNPKALEQLKIAFPELILLVSSADDDSDTNAEVLKQFREVNRFFRTEANR